MANKEQHNRDREREKKKKEKAAAAAKAAKEAKQQAGGSSGPGRALSHDDTSDGPAFDLNPVREQMSAYVNNYRTFLGTLASGRILPTQLDEVKCTVHGEQVPLKALAQVRMTAHTCEQDSCTTCAFAAV